MSRKLESAYLLKDWRLNIPVFYSAILAMYPSKSELNFYSTSLPLMM